MAIPLFLAVQFPSSVHQRISWLSLDVVSGALAGMLFFARLFRVELDLWGYVLLAGAVWSIYTLDHLLDAEKIPPGSSLDRHSFHSRNRKSLWVTWIIVVIFSVSGGFVYFGFSVVLMLALGLGALILVVIGLLRKFEKNFAWLKELSNAFFYVIGISWLPIFFASSVEFNLPSFGLALTYFGLAFLNLLMLSSLDAKADQTKGFNSIASFLSQQKIIQTIRLLSLGLVLVSLSGALFFLSFYRIFAILILLMVGLHYLIFFGQKKQIENKRREMELAFSFPWLLLFF